MPYDMSPPQARAFLLAGTRTAKLATALRDGHPHVVPIWFVLDGDDVVFTTGRDTVKGRHILRDGRVSLCVDADEPPFAYVHLRGRARVVDDPDALLEWATRIAARYMGADQAEAFGRRNAVPEELLVRVTPERTVAKFRAGEEQLEEGVSLHRFLSIAVLVAAAFAPAASAGAASIWTPVASGTTQNISAIEYQSESRAWFATAGGQIFRRDGGGTFVSALNAPGVSFTDNPSGSGRRGAAGACVRVRPTHVPGGPAGALAGPRSPRRKRSGVLGSQVRRVRAMSPACR